MTYHFTAIIEQREESYVAYCPQLEEAGHVDGTDFEEVMAILQSAVEIVVKEMKERGEEIPQPKQVFVGFIEVEA